MSKHPEPPKELKADGKALWRKLVAAYGIDDTSELVMLLTVCRCEDQIAAASDAIERHGQLIEGSHGGLVRNPACLTLKDAQALQLKAMKQLGFEFDASKDKKPKSHAGWAG